MTPRRSGPTSAAALAARGIGEQPPRWLDTVAVALSTGHRYVEDAAPGRAAV